VRNLLFVLVFISIIVLGCGWFKSPLENCADIGFTVTGNTKDYVREFLKKSYKEKMQGGHYAYWHRQCEQLRMDAPKTFDAKYQ